MDHDQIKMWNSVLFYLEGMNEKLMKLLEMKNRILWEEFFIEEYYRKKDGDHDK